jgi:hypothetical protein
MAAGGAGVSRDLGGLETAATYLPDILEEALSRHRLGAQWVEPVDGTLVMLDVSGFTPLTERLARAGKEGAEWLFDVMCGLFSGAGHRSRAIAATLDVLGHVEDQQTIRAGSRRIHIRVSAGAHCGRLWLMTMGEPEHGMGYLLVGDDAEKTARGQAAAPDGALVRDRVEDASALLAKSGNLAGRMSSYYEQALRRIELAQIGLAGGDHGVRWAARQLERAEDALRRSGALPDAQRAAETRAAVLGGT